MRRPFLFRKHPRQLKLNLKERLGYLLAELEWFMDWGPEEKTKFTCAPLQVHNVLQSNAATAAATASNGINVSMRYCMRACTRNCNRGIPSSASCFSMSSSTSSNSSSSGI